MKVRGTRECSDCGTRWSYYETGSVECPDCGSLQSVGVDEERRLHTDNPAELDLTAARNALDGATLRESAERAVAAAREYLRPRGFIDGGTLRTLDDTYLAAAELRAVADAIGRRRSVDDDEESYYLSLLAGADAGDRPAPGAVPESLRDSRGLAYANAVHEYRQEVRDYLAEHPDELAAGVLSRLTDHEKRHRALDGDVSPQDAERLVEAARAVGRYLREDDETALAMAETRLDALA